MRFNFKKKNNEGFKFFLSFLKVDYKKKFTKKIEFNIRKHHYFTKPSEKLFTLFNVVIKDYNPTRRRYFI